MLRTCLITKLVTTNVGNQALSNEMIRLLRSTHGRNLVAVMGRPTGLEGYSLDRLKAVPSNPVRVFNEWADRVVTGYRQHRHLYHPPHRPDELPQVTLIHPSTALTYAEAIKRPLRALRGALRGLGVYGHAYASRLCTLDHCDRIIYNGAGEIRDSNIALRQLLELRIAQQLGRSVVPINHGIVIKDQVLKDILLEVYRHCTAIVVRGTDSQNVLTAGGVSATNIHLAHDVAFLATLANEGTVASVARREAVTPGTVGISLTGFHGHDLSGWEAIIRGLRARGKTVMFVSNDLYQDAAVGRVLRDRFGIKMMSQQYGYQEYIGLLSKLDLVISGRLHTNIFAMVGSTPAIPLENCDGKMEEVFRFIDPSIEVINMSRQNWVERGLDTVARIYGNYGAARESLIERTQSIRQSLTSIEATC